MTALVAHPERSAQMMGVDEPVLSTWAHRRNLHNNQRLECKTHCHGLIFELIKPYIPINLTGHPLPALSVDI